MKRSVRKLWCMLIAMRLRSNIVNKSFKTLGRMRKAFSIILIIIVPMIYILVIWLATPPLNRSDRFAQLIWIVNLTVLLLLGVVVYFYFELLSLTVDVAIIQRKLWFIEHRLGLPHELQELEDTKAYNEWLKEYIVKKLTQCAEKSSEG